jgi:HicB-like antitoxin of HicAB toxin-antitoxin system
MASEGPAVRYYIALAHCDPRRGFAVTFPDFPGWFANVRNFDQVRVVAARGLALLIEEMQSCGETVPHPSSFDDLASDPNGPDRETMLIAGPPILGERAFRPHAGARFSAGFNDEWPDAPA